MGRSIAAGSWMPVMMVGFGFMPAAATARSCEHITPPARLPATPVRPLDIEDLVRLRDIGVNAVNPPDPRAFAVSPDGRQLAFQLRQADPATNSYCLAMFVTKVRPGAPVVMIDQGGEFLRRSFDFRGKAGFPSGLPMTITPVWSPDGSWVAFLKRVGSTTQVWRASADGRGSTALTASPIDVEDFRITADGSAIVFATRPDLARKRASIAQEALRGFRYDDRYSPMSSDRPFPSAPVEPEYSFQDLATGTVRPATDLEAAALRPPTDMPRQATSISRSATGGTGWIIPGQTNDRPGSNRLFARMPDGPAIECSAAACTDWVSRIWWTADGRRLRFFRREGWGLGATAIYEWTPGRGVPRRLYSTADLLSWCEPLKDQLVCLAETSAEPRRLILLDPVSGRLTPLFDPNPEIGRLRLGSIERLQWRNAFGVETYGDLVRPVGYQRGKRYPLVVVQYETRGFLRGGTGDEYPIQAFANRGYAVLSFNRPLDIGYLRAARNGDVGKANLAGFADRESVQSSLESGIGMLVARGIVDPKRIGITGLSEGAASAQYGLLNSSLFAAAVMSNCCLDPTLAMFVGPIAARHFAEEGFPTLNQDDQNFWKRTSLARNARAFDTPLLLQVSDDEYLSSLEGVTALREAGAPVDMFVYPDEHHIKWQPAHRLAIYRRNLDWFDYWLKGERPSSPDGRSEVAAWDLMRR
jgi:dipeptidyl aminopeptidase/acylaminoacyl peptidase